MSRMCGEETPGQIGSKFCLVIGTQDEITCVKFGNDRLRGFWLAKVYLFP